MTQPNSCPRCASSRPSNRLGADWCCWELVALEALMEGPTPATMRQLTTVYFIGRSEKSIDAACRRYGFKIPAREKAKRRQRCAACNTLFERSGGARVCTVCIVEEVRADRERVAA